jgi:hypothetical protein
VLSQLQDYLLIAAVPEWRKSLSPEHGSKNYHSKIWHQVELLLKIALAIEKHCTNCQTQAKIVCQLAYTNGSKCVVFNAAKEAEESLHLSH